MDDSSEAQNVENNVCGSYSEILQTLWDLQDENMELKHLNEFLKRRCDEYCEEAGLNNDYFE